MTRRFDEIVIIYNPNSTGDGKRNAQAFGYELRQRMPKQMVKLTKTKYAGHAVEIARRHAKSGRRMLLISSSGDGGYHEVINGVLEVNTNKVATAVLPSGNANDHATAVGSGELIGRIIAGKVEKIELLEVAAHVNGDNWVRYSHSYVGFGLTPKVGRELTARKLNVINEKWHVLYNLLKFKHVDLEHGGKIHKYSSLVVATIDRMSKVVKLAPDAEKNDGKMEVYETLYANPRVLLSMLLQASLKGLRQSHRTTSITLKTRKRTLVQLDGEVFTLDADSDVTISCKKNALLTVL